jgi:hypothetical protein
MNSANETFAIAAIVVTTMQTAYLLNFLGFFVDYCDIISGLSNMVGSCQ